MAEVVHRLVEHFDWHGKVGVAFPAVVRNGVARSAANIDHSWIGTDIDAVFTAASELRRPRHQRRRRRRSRRDALRRRTERTGVVIMLTFGTGIGSGLFLDGKLVPNTELGHLYLDGEEAEHRAAAIVRDREKLSWKEWGRPRPPLPRTRRVPVLARPVHRRRWGQPQGRQVAAVRRRSTTEIVAADARERGRHRRRRARRRAGRRPAETHRATAQRRERD